MYKTELPTFDRKMDTLNLLRAQDCRIIVPFLLSPYEPYIPHGIIKAGISKIPGVPKHGEMPFRRGWLRVERNAEAEAIGKHAVRLCLLNNIQEGSLEAAAELPFGAIKYNNLIDRVPTPTQKTHGVILESSGYAAGLRTWRATLTTESALTDWDKYGFTEVLKQLTGEMSDRWNGTFRTESGRSAGTVFLHDAAADGA
ncbi:MAG TPA: hypothetical protein VLG16_00565 [Candidatus Saccharimonadales bacterium]|nr:hypothetical protein [Candidatus Saccharimonadales bacterium]